MIKHALIAFLAITLSYGCMNQQTDSQPSGTNHEHLNQDRTGPEYTSKYICPMHCKGSGADTKGICPVCKMDYVKNKQYKP